MARRRRSRQAVSSPSYSAQLPPELSHFSVNVQTQRRDASAIASAVPFHEALFSDFPRSGRLTLRTVEDRRTFHPERYRPAAGLRNQRHKLVLLNASKKAARNPLRPFSLPTTARIGFRGARSVVICMRRRMRREALWALNRVGRGAPRRRPRRNAYSSILCRRS